MSQYPGSGYLYSPIFGGAYGAGGGIVFDFNDPKPSTEKVKPAPPITRPYTSGGAGQWPGYGAFPIGFNAYFAWLMRNYPICNAIHWKIAGPVMSGTRNYEVIDDGGDAELAKEMKSIANREVLPTLNKAIAGAMEAPFFGNSLEELIWQADRKTKRINPVDVRPIPHRQQFIRVNEARQYIGYTSMGQERDAAYGFLYVHNPQIDDVMGWSPNSAALADYFRATKSAENADAIERKASGIQLLMYMMQGAQIVDGNGNPVDQQKFMDAVMNAAVEGKSAALPLMYFSKDAIERFPELAKVEVIKIDRFDWGNLGPMIEAHSGRQRDLHTHICWAWGVSERSLMEADKGGIGTSDAEEHGDSNTDMSELWHTNVCEQWDKQVTARWVNQNFRDSGVLLKAVPAQLADPEKSHLQKVQLAVMSNPITAPKAAAQIDMRKLFERTETPLVSEEDAEKALAETEQKQKDAEAAKVKQMQANQPPASNGPNPKPNEKKSDEQASKENGK